MADGVDRQLRKRIQPLISTIFEAEPRPPKVKKTRQEINKTYYEKVKAENPEKYKERLKAQAPQSKKYREQLKAPGNEEKLKESREKAKLRVREYRRRQKEKELNDPSPGPSKTVITRKNQEALKVKREKERLRKEKERAKWPHQKKTAENAKNLARYHKKNNTSKKKVDTDTQTEVTATVCATKAAVYQATYRGRKALPQNAAARKEILIKMCEKEGISVVAPNEAPVVLPRIRDRGLNKKLARHLLDLRGRKTHVQNLKQQMGFGRKRLSYFKNKVLKTKSDVKAKAVKDFFKTHARTLPDRKKTKDGEPTYVLEESIDSLYTEFQKESSINVSRTFFFKNRDLNVKRMDEIKFNQSLCESCENFRLTCDVLGKFSDIFKGSKTQVIDRFLCEKEGKYHKKACLNRSCDRCDTIKQLFSTEEENEVVVRKQWELKETGKGSKKKMLTTTVTSVKTVFQDFMTHMATVPLHLFFAKWQYGEFTAQHKNVHSKEVISVLDFAENYRCASQDEVQSAYWHYSQATVHPIVNYVRCEPCNTVKTHTVVFISDDLEHDYHAVETFWARNLNLLRQNNHIETARQWSDGCGAQYKSRMPFGYIQAGQKRYGLKMLERNFFGSRHGKNPSDGVSAVVKGRATRAVKCRRAIIQSAKDLFLFSQKNLTVEENCQSHAARSFIFISKEDINRPKFTTLALKGTRGLHNVRAVGDSLLWHRNLSCLCSGCKAGHDCKWGDYTEPWKNQDMLPYGMEDVYGTDTSYLNSTVELEELSTSTLNYLENVTNELAMNSSFSITQEINALTPSLLAPSPAVPPETAPCLALPSENDAPTSPSLSMSSENVKTTAPSPELLTDPPAATDQPLLPTPQLRSGTWVIAKFPGKTVSSRQSFLGLILSVEDGEANVKFCRRSGRWFTWPVIDDIGWMPTYSLIPIDPPSMDAREKMFLSQAQLDLF